jgi:hypothetical protein
MIRILTDLAPSPVVVANIRRLERRRELVVQGPGTAGKSDDYAISYCIDGKDSVQIAAGPPSFGTGVAFKGDMVRLLQSLSDQGGVTVPISPPTGATREGTFSLNGLKTVREKLAAARKWPHAIAPARN